MKRSDATHLNCSIARSLEILGEWWTLLIMRDAFFGLRRFEDFIEDLGISRGVLTDRLRTLVDHGVLEKRLYQSAPDRYEYRLTDKGRELFPVIVALMQWGDRWLSTPAVGGPPLIMRHTNCGHDITGPLRCSSCDEAVHASEISIEAGPGAAPDAAPPTASTGATQ